ncbi:MAG: ATP-binding protein [Geminicoccaceae bacterium]
MRRTLFLKFLALTLAIGAVIGAVIMVIHAGQRRDQMMGELSAEVATLATRLARPLAAEAGENPVRARDLLGVFAGLPYVICVDFFPTADGPPVSWPPIGCGRMRAGEDLMIPALGAGPEAHYAIRLDRDALDEIMWGDFVVLVALALAVGIAVLLAAAIVFQRIINRPLRQLVRAMTRFEVENVPERVDWKTTDEIGEVAGRYNAMLDREVDRVAELEERREELARLVDRLGEARDAARLERDKAEQALADLKAAQDRLVQAEKMASLGQLTAGVAHEIKNPLNFVNNFASLSRELLEELQTVIDPAVATLDEDARDDAKDLLETLDMNLGKVAEHGGRADRIIKNMLLHSRQGPGTRSRTEVNHLVEESLGLAYHGARAEKRDFQIHLVKHLDPAAGAIDGYPQELQRVLVNLFSNSFYAVGERRGREPAGGFEPTLTVTTEDRGDAVAIRVHDNGSGIPDSVRKKLFTPFFTTKPPGDGTGLGLSLSHDIVVKQHGGTLDVASEPDSFTEFTITLPRHSAEAERAGTAEAAS